MIQLQPPPPIWTSDNTIYVIHSTKKIPQKKFAFTIASYLGSIVYMILHYYAFHHHIKYNWTHCNDFYNVYLSQRYCREQLLYLCKMTAFKYIYFLLVPNPWSIYKLHSIGLHVVFSMCNHCIFFPKIIFIVLITYVVKVCNVARFATITCLDVFALRLIAYFGPMQHHCNIVTLDFFFSYIVHKTCRHILCSRVFHLCYLSSVCVRMENSQTSLIFTSSSKKDKVICKCLDQLVVVQQVINVLHYACENFVTIK
jgi:hypothetical protein